MNELEKARAWASAEARIADLEAENARLQERGDGYKSESEVSFARARRAEVENARLQRAVSHQYDQYKAYKALAERRKEALEKFRLGESDHFFGCGVFHKLDKKCTSACADARAAINISPEQAREKERR